MGFKHTFLTNQHVFAKFLKFFNGQGSKFYKRVFFVSYHDFLQDMIDKFGHSQGKNKA